MNVVTATPALEEAPHVDGSPFRQVRILVALRGPGRHSTWKVESVVLDFTGRTTPKLYRLHDEGTTFECETWLRLDTEADCYVDVLEEAKANGKNPHLS